MMTVEEVRQDAIRSLRERPVEDRHCFYLARDTDVDIEVLTSAFDGIAAYTTIAGVWYRVHFKSGTEALAALEALCPTSS